MQKKKKKTETQTLHLTPFTKLNSKHDKLKCKHKTTKLPEDDIGENLGDFGFGDQFLDTTPKS